jgi:hypothetical protein
MTRTNPLTLAGALALAGLLVTGDALAADAGKPPAEQCFRSGQYQGFHALNDHTMIIRVNVNDFYRIEMAGTCPELTQPDAILITEVRGSDMICGPLDWDLKVREPGPGGFAVPCIVKSQTKLTPTEVAALRRKDKP